MKEIVLRTEIKTQIVRKGGREERMLSSRKSECYQQIFHLAKGTLDFNLNSRRPVEKKGPTSPWVIKLMPPPAIKTEHSFLKKRPFNYFWPVTTVDFLKIRWDEQFESACYKHRLQNMSMRIWQLYVILYFRTYVLITAVILILFPRRFYYFVPALVFRFFVFLQKNIVYTQFALTFLLRFCGLLNYWDFYCGILFFIGICTKAEIQRRGICIKICNL